MYWAYTKKKEILEASATCTHPLKTVLAAFQEVSSSSLSVMMGDDFNSNHCKSIARQTFLSTWMLLVPSATYSNDLESLRSLTSQPSSR